MDIPIEEIVLANDRRGISGLRHHLPQDNYQETARFVLEQIGPAMLVTGFYVNGTAETDGPPGTVVLARALRDLGFEVCLVTDQYCGPLLRTSAQNEFPVIEFPIAGDNDSSAIALDLLTRYTPEIVIAIERCGFTRDHVYKNMRGVDVSKHTARLDYLILNHARTVGIGDGGNEIGMGSVYEKITTIPSLVPDPAATSTTHLLIASVSNWGAYGLVTGLSVLSGQVLLPSIEAEWELVQAVVDAGGVDGISGQPIYKVDGFGFEQNAQVLEHLHQYLDTRV